MKKKLGILAAGAVVVILAYLYAYIDKNVYLYDRSLDSSEFTGTGVLLEGEELSQTFTCLEDKIDGMNLKASVVGAAGDVLVEYMLVDQAGGEEIRASISGSEIENNKFNQLKFESVQNSRGKTYRFVIRETGTNENNGISFYTGPTEEQKEELTVKGEEKQGVLIARYVAHRFDVETFVVLLGFIAFVAAFIKMLYKLFK